MPEGVHGYPRWDGQLRKGPAFPVIAAQDLKRAWDSFWGRVLIIVVLAYAVMAAGNLWTLSRMQGDAVHTLDQFLQTMYVLPWGTLAIAAVMTGPSLLSDHQHGALELYLSRAVTRWDYMAGKILAVLGLTTLTIFGPAVLYWLASFVFFETHPDGWAWVPLGALAFALMWGLLVTGLGLGLSCVSRSTRAASLVLFGGFAIMHAIVSSIIAELTRNPEWNILSPFDALRQQSEWMFSTPADYGFPAWWGLIHWGLLTVVGWALLAWKYPRVRGEE